MLHTIFAMLVVACAMLAAHEAGHVIATQWLGGRWLGVERKGFLIGVRLSIGSLSVPRIALTLAAGPIAEILVTTTAWIIRPQDYALWVLLLALQWIGNVIPWHVIPNDGTRLWQLWKQGAIETPQ